MGSSRRVPERSKDSPTRPSHDDLVPSEPTTSESSSVWKRATLSPSTSSTEPSRRRVRRPRRSPPRSSDSSLPLASSESASEWLTSETDTRPPRRPRLSTESFSTSDRRTPRRRRRNEDDLPSQSQRPPSAETNSFCHVVLNFLSNQSILTRDKIQRELTCLTF